MWDMLLPAVAILGGTIFAANANSKAAETASNATLQAAQVQADAITKGNQQAQQTLQKIQDQAAPAGTYLRQVIAEPGTLTPAQTVQLEDLRRSVGNQIHSSNFAGSGRTAVALFKKSESDFTNEALDQNRQRALTAAGGMYGAATGAATGSANADINTGLQVGKTFGDAGTRAGLYDAQAGLATGQLTGKAIGDIGSLIATTQRDSRYSDRLSGIEKSLGMRA